MPMKLKTTIWFLLAGALSFAGVAACAAQRQMENLDRGVVAFNKGSRSVYVSWRMVGLDTNSIAFNLYRSTGGAAAVKLNTSPIAATTDYNDSGVNTNQSNAYYVKPVVGGVEGSASAAFTLSAQPPVRQYLSIPFNSLTGAVATASVGMGDLDGDGAFDLVVKWSYSGSRDPANSSNSITDTAKIDAYKLDGTFMWRIDLGWNIEVGNDYNPILVYDLDGDGKAEVITRTSELTTDGTGIQIPGSDYRDPVTGRVLTGPEYLSIFRGTDGREIARTNWIARGNVSDWGDSYGNRVSRHLMGIAYLDGIRPSILMCRGVYNLQKVEAWNYRNGSLGKLWGWSNGGSGTSGSQCVRMADCDGDGYDELIKGNFVLDHNGSMLWDDGFGHGDGMQVSVIDPTRAGLQIFTITEPSTPYGLALLDASNGAVLWNKTNTYDTGRATAAHIDPRYTGLQCWADYPDLINYDGSVLCSGGGPKYSSSYNTIWFDGGLVRSVINEHSDGCDVDTWSYGSCSTGGGLMPRTGSGYIGGSVVVADIIGDWREELITVYQTEVRVYSTTIPSSYRFYTMMHDKLYRLNVGQWQQRRAGSSLPGFYLGTGMGAQPATDIYYAGMASTNRPIISSVRVVGNSIVLAGTNGFPGATCYLLSSTNPALPAMGWSRLATNQVPGDGRFGFTNIIKTQELHRFYMIQH